MTDKQIEDMQAHLISFGIENKYNAEQILKQFQLPDLEMAAVSETLIEAPLHIWYKACKILA